MPLSLAVISYDISDYAGVDFDARRTKVYATNNVIGGAVIDTDGNKIYLGSGNATIAADGTGSISVPIPGAGSNPASWQTTIHVDYPDRNNPRGRTTRSFGPFTITASANLADLVPQQEVPAEYLTQVTAQLDTYVTEAKAARDQAVDISNISTSDGVMAAVQADPTSQFAIDQKATYVAPVNVRAYGAKGDGITNDTAAIQAAINVSTAAAPRAIYFPNGVYKITAELTIPATAHGTTLRGESRKSTVIHQATTATPIIAMRSDMLHSIEVTGLTLRYATPQTTIGGSAFWYDGPSASNNFYQHVYDRLTIEDAYRCFSVSDNMPNQALWGSSWSNINCIRTKDTAFKLSRGVGSPTNTMRNIGIYNTSDASLRTTGPAFMLSGAHAIMTNISIEGWTNVAFYVEGGSKVSVENLTIEGHIIDQSINQVVFVQPSSWISIRNFGFDGRATANNTAWSVFLRSASAYTCRLTDGTFQSDHTLGGAYLRQLVYSDDPAAVLVENCRKTAGTMDGPGIGPYKVGSAKQLGPRRPSATRTETVSYAAAANDHTIIANGATVTITLPDAATVSVGTEYVVKNINAAACTVAAAGFPATIDGAASKSLAQWAVGHYLSDGSNWITV